MLAERWLAAGLCWGLALGLKPHGLLLAPVWGLAVVIAQRRWKVVAGGGVALATLLLAAAPFVVHSGWAWWAESYYANVFSPHGEYVRVTTLNAFNLWYLDLLVTDSTNAAAPLLGITRSAWARALLVSALAAVLLVVMWRWRRDSRGLVLYAPVSLLCFMMLSTQVHERYLILVLPFLTIAAVLWSRLRLPLVILTFVALAQVSWPQWLQTAAGRRDQIIASPTAQAGGGAAAHPHEGTIRPSEEDRQQMLSAYEEGRARTRGFEWGVVLLALSATVLVARATLALGPESSAGMEPRWELEVPRGPRARLLASGLPLLLAVSTAYGVLGVHYSTDTWISLAAGRQILSTPAFPLADTFSYTFAGATWFNQNWLSSVVLWFLYDHLGDAGLVLVMLMLEATIVALVLLTVWFRSRSWPAGLLTASLIAAASRDWLGFRAATLQLLLLAALVLALSALRSRNDGHRWWPVVVLGAVVAVWPHTHGSFVFGFGLLGVFLLCAVLTRMRGGNGLDNARLAALTALLAVGVLLGAALSPFGIENLTHPLKVSGSDVFRQVSEWRPPYQWAEFPPVAPYWAVFVAAAVLVAVAAGLRAVGAPRSDRASLEEPGRGADLGGLLFDLTCVALGIGLSLWARRFAPYFFIVASGPLVAAAFHLAHSRDPELLGRLRRIARQGAWVALGVLAPLTAFNARRDLVERVRPRHDGGRYTLLERMVQLDESPTVAMDFLRINRLRCNLFTEWRLAGTAMFLTPDVKVFIDGRSQQLYDELHYLAYRTIFSAPADEEESGPSSRPFCHGRGAPAVDTAGAGPGRLPRHQRPVGPDSRRTDGRPLREAGHESCSLSSAVGSAITTCGGRTSPRRTLVEA